MFLCSSRFLGIVSIFHCSVFWTSAIVYSMRSFTLLQKVRRLASGTSSATFWSSQVCLIFILPSLLQRHKLSQNSRHKFPFFTPWINEKENNCFGLLIKVTSLSTFLLLLKKLNEKLFFFGVYVYVCDLKLNIVS